MTKIIKTEKELRILMYVVFFGMFYTSFMAHWGVDWDWIDLKEVGIATGGTGAHLMMFMPLLILLAIYGKWQERLAAIFVMPFVLDFLPNTPSGSRATLVMLELPWCSFCFCSGKNAFESADSDSWRCSCFCFFF